MSRDYPCRCRDSQDKKCLRSSEVSSAARQLSHRQSRIAATPLVVFLQSLYGRLLNRAHRASSHQNPAPEGVTRCTV